MRIKGVPVRVPPAAGGSLSAGYALKRPDLHTDMECLHDLEIRMDQQKADFL
jgi:hypothetical protein